MKSTTLLCNTESLLKKNFPKFGEICDRACIDIKKHQMCVVIPTKAKLDEYHKEMIKLFGDLSHFWGGDEKAAEERKQKVLGLKSVIYSHFLKEVITPDFKGGIISSGAQEQVKLSAVDAKGKLSLFSGKGFSTEATGRLADIQGTPNYSSGNRSISVIILEKGEMVNGGEKTQMNPGKPRLANKLDGGGPEVLPNNAAVYEIKQSANQMLLDSCCGVGRDFYIPVIAGMMKCMEAEGVDFCKKYAHFVYPCAASTFYTLVQPHNKLGQFLPDDFIRKWMCVPFFCNDYNKQRDDFLRKYSEPGARIELANKIKDYPEVSKLNEGFKSMYEGLYNQLFPPGFSPLEKLWADELGYRIYIAIKDDITSCNRADELAKVSNGEHVESQSLFADKEFWSNIMATKFEKKSSDFFRGDWIVHKGGESHYKDGPPMPYYYRKLVELNH